MCPARTGIAVDSGIISVLGNKKAIADLCKPEYARSFNELCLAGGVVGTPEVDRFAALASCDNYPESLAGLNPPH